MTTGGNLAESSLDVRHPLDAYGITRHIVLSWPHLQNILPTLNELSDHAG